MQCCDNIYYKSVKTQTFVKLQLICAHMLNNVPAIRKLTFKLDGTEDFHVNKRKANLKNKQGRRIRDEIICFNQDGNADYV